jgi:hypothetical protein
MLPHAFAVLKTKSFIRKKIRKWEADYIARRMFDDFPDAKTETSNFAENDPLGKVLYIRAVRNETVEGDRVIDLKMVFGQKCIFAAAINRNAKRDDRETQRYLNSLSLMPSLDALNSEPEAAQAALACAAAYDKGEFASTIREFQTIGEQAKTATEFNVLYAQGRGAPEEEVKDIGWHSAARHAADQGHPVAQFCLGLAYRYGLGVPQDGRQAATWYHYASNQGVNEATYNLARMYLRGEGVLQDTDNAHGLLDTAALRGHAKAQAALADMYENGWVDRVRGRRIMQGTDYVQAYFWYSLALLNPASDRETLGTVRSKLDSLIGKMTPTQIAVGQQAVHDWTSKAQ